MFRSFEGPTADHVWQQVVAAFRVGDGVLIQPSRGGETREILHATITINDPRQRWIASREPALNVAFALAEVVWMVTGRNDLAFLKAWNSRLPQYVGTKSEVHGAYGYRLRHHLGIDQLTRVYHALRSNPDSRQALLQIWHSSVDLPHTDGSPVDMDIPCNALSLLKVREGSLEWLQVIRSNDLFLGVPHNFVQFMTLQEIMAGWLGVDCGAYHQVSDSLHIYGHDEESVFGSTTVPDLPPNTDSLALPKNASESAFEELGRKIEQLIAVGIDRDRLKQIAAWDDGPGAFRNILSVLASESARRQSWHDLSEEIMATCTNSLYKELQRRWLTRVGVRWSSRPRNTLNKPH